MIRIILTFISLKVEGTLNCRINPVDGMSERPYTGIAMYCIV